MFIKEVKNLALLIVVMHGETSAGRQLVFH